VILESPGSVARGSIQVPARIDGSDVVVSVDAIHHHNQQWRHSRRELWLRLRNRSCRSKQTASVAVFPLGLIRGLCSRAPGLALGKSDRVQPYDPRCSTHAGGDLCMQCCVAALLFCSRKFTLHFALSVLHAIGALRRTRINTASLSTSITISRE
jgi:hypothetical protein